MNYIFHQRPWWSWWEIFWPAMETFHCTFPTHMSINQITHRSDLIQGTDYIAVTQLMALPICHCRFSIFVLETLKFEWQCSQHIELNPICAIWNLFWNLLWKWSRRRYDPIEFPHNTYSWRFWHYCTTSSGNKLKIVNSWIKVKAKSYLAWHCELKSIWLITVSDLFAKLSNTKMATLPTLCITWKLE